MKVVATVKPVATVPVATVKAVAMGKPVAMGNDRLPFESILCLMVDDTSPFLEVFCEISGKNYRFTSGTKAEFAVFVINRKLGPLRSRVIYIEAVKEGEEPISFGDGASLVDYGHGWKLKTVIDADFPGNLTSFRFQDLSLRTCFNELRKRKLFSGIYRESFLHYYQRNASRRVCGFALQGSEDSKSTRESKPEVEGDQSLKYIWRIMIAFVLMFILGGLFTVALENLPRFILLFNNPSM
ncbi:unnamed protein product [Thlaspi arvense]|uniref:Transmembrane protein n=1 Tax=Thlaspi arvense TaxID=13288 RepID=A0AAU9T5R0_THLAR|nr:unnamed protein product [Thlaspi arvense]